MSSGLPKEIVNQIPKISPFAVAAICIISALALTAFAAWHEEEREAEIEQSAYEGQEDLFTPTTMMKKEEIESKKDEIFARWLTQQQSR